MRSAQRGAVTLRAAGAAASIAGLALLSFGTVASAAAEPGMTSKASAVRDGNSATLTDKIVLTLAANTAIPEGGVGTPHVWLYTGDCAPDKDHPDTDEVTEDNPGTGDNAEKDVLVNGAVGSDVVKTDGKLTWTASTEGVKVKVDEGKSDFHFIVTWRDLTTCEDVAVPAKPEATATPTASPTATPLATATPTATPIPVVTTSTTSAVSAVSAVKTPATGADLPFAAGGLLTLSSLGLLLGGARRRRNSR